MPREDGRDGFLQGDKDLTGASIVLTAGGTGGHLFPAQALAGELIRRGYEVDLITDIRAIHFGANFPGRAVHKVPSATFRGKSPIEAMKMVATNSNGFKMAYDIMGDLKPKAMVGFGGYPTIPPVLAALARGIPSMIHEQNSVMGRANRFLAPMVKAIAVSFEDTKFLEGKLTEKSYLTGTPLREGMLDHARRHLSAARRPASRSTSCASAAARARASSPTSCRSRCNCCRRSCATG